MLLACVLASLAQGPLPTEPREQLVDQVSLVVNDDIITWRTIKRREAREERRRRIDTERERARLLDNLLAEEVERLLSMQGGQDLGLPDDLVRRQIELHTARFVESQGGVIGASERLALADVDSKEAKEQWRGELLSSTWRESVTGEGPNGVGRVVTDRYVRPGRMAMEYGEFERALRDRTGSGRDPRVLGGRRESVQLQELQVGVGRSGGPDKARERILEAKLAADAGEDFGALVRRLSDVTAGDGVVDLHEVDLIVRANPEFEEFLSAAKVDDISPIYPIMQEERIVGFRILRLLERVPAELPAFVEGTTQERLRGALLEEHDRRRIDQALGELFRRAYIWPEELRGR